MKLKQVFAILFSILSFIVLLKLSYFLFSTIATMDLAVSATPIFERTEFELLLINIRKIIVMFLSFFFTCTVDFRLVKKVLIKFKMEKYNKKILICFIILTVFLFIGLLVFCNVYSL